MLWQRTRAASGRRASGKAQSWQEGTAQHSTGQRSTAQRSCGSSSGTHDDKIGLTASWQVLLQGGQGGHNGDRWRSSAAAAAAAARDTHARTPGCACTRCTWGRNTPAAGCGTLAATPTTAALRPPTPPSLHAEGPDLHAEGHVFTGAGRHGAIVQLVPRPRERRLQPAAQQRRPVGAPHLAGAAPKRQAAAQRDCGRAGVGHGRRAGLGAGLSRRGAAQKRSRAAGRQIQMC